ncbi:MAG: hypothetical protein O3C19_06955 [Bacteroidetes bacterium]|nr:hypothetical protein [Bacteroidota bacterium]
MQKFKVADNGNANGTAKNAVAGVTVGTSYKAEVWNDNIFNLFEFVENAGYSLIDDDLSQMTKAAKGDYRATYTYNTSAIATQSVNDIVRGSDGKYYKCQADGVVGDNPVGSVTGNWVQVLLDKGVEISSTAEAQAGVNNSKLLTPLRLREGLNATGAAPIYACRAWVNFKGTGAVTIRASGNVSSITDNGSGDYTVNLTTAMPDANYCVVAAGSSSLIADARQGPGVSNSSTSAIAVYCGFDNGGGTNWTFVNVAVFR